MENASKALLIAAAVLIVIILIAFGMIILNSTKDTAEHAQGVGSSISDSSEKAASKLLGLFDKTGKGSLKHNGTIPEGGSYYVAALNTNILAGENMPDSPGNGDIYSYGDYSYKYLDDLNIYAVTGWRVNSVADKTKESYENILEEINGSSIAEMFCTFMDCTLLKEAPELPNNVQHLNATFRGCTSLIKAPKIPESVTDMSQTFFECTSLKEALIEIPSSVELLDATFACCTSLAVAPKINYGVKYMFHTFEGCTSLEKAPEIPGSVEEAMNVFASCTALTGDIKINCDPIFWEGFFMGTDQPIEITGDCSLETKENLAATAESGKVTY